MTYVLQIAQDQTAPQVDDGLLRALHFMMIKHDLNRKPGRWRPGDIYVRNDETGQIVYEGPAADRIPALIDAAINELEKSQEPVLVRAAVAHLNLVMIHPYSDGNGVWQGLCKRWFSRGSRFVAPVFSSIEEYLGRNTQAYYDILAEVGRGSWNPSGSTVDLRVKVRETRPARSTIDPFDIARAESEPRLL